MKHLALILILTFVTGCTALRRSLYTQQPVLVRPAETNAVAIAETNVVTTTNAPAGSSAPTVTTNYMVTRSTNYVVSPPVWVTNLTPRVEVAGATNAVSALPVPYAGLVGTGLGALIAGYASWQNRKQLGVANQVMGTLVDNFELVRQTALRVPGYTSEMDGRVMDAVKAAQQAAGVKAAINLLVDQRRGQDAPAPQSTPGA